MPKEPWPERRVALVPEIAGRLVQEGWEVLVERGAGAAAFFQDAAYEAQGARLVERKELWRAELVLSVQPLQELQDLASGTILIGFQYPYRAPERVRELAHRSLSALAMELIPRITRAQPMDALSSQATVSGYVGALWAAQASPRFFPMLTTAAGTIRPAQVLVLGIGVAGLQAIATVRRLGATVWAYDVRAAALEQARSLGARVLELPIQAEGEGGYARELSEEERQLQEAALNERVAQMDAVITAAQVFGRPAPRLLSEEAVRKMRSGAVVVDLAAESGGNCTLSRPGEVVEVGGVRILAPANPPAELPLHASEMYARNLYHLIRLLYQGGQPHWDDEILQGALLTHQGTVTYEPIARLLERS